jgi:hypothetical protein
MNRKDFTKKVFLGSALFAATPILPLSMEKNTFDDESPAPEFRPLFNGRNLDGFVDMNTSEDTWWVENGILKCTGKPIGVMRTEKQYENFILDIEWRHMEPGGNSGVFVWANGTPYQDNPYPKGMEVQMLDTQWAEINDGPVEYVHGHLFPAMELEGTIPDNPSEIEGRSYSLENRVNGTGEWNQYTVVCVDGTVKLSVNGKFVNGIRSTKRKKGYICPESEGSEVHFRKINIMELPGSVLTQGQSAPKVD